jgi:uncharacterized membrane protein YoaT (DUF817 family)
MHTTGKQWIRVFSLTATLWPGVVSVATLANNVAALYYASSRTIHFGTLVRITLTHVHTRAHTRTRHITHRHTDTHSAMSPSLGSVGM